MCYGFLQSLWLLAGEKKKASTWSATARPPARDNSPSSRPVATLCSLRRIRDVASLDFSPYRSSQLHAAPETYRTRSVKRPRREETIKHDTSLAGLRGGSGRRDNRRINHSNRRKRAARTNRAAAELSPNSSIVRRLFRAGIRSREKERERERETTWDPASPWGLGGFRDFRGRCETRGYPERLFLPGVPVASSAVLPSGRTPGRVEGAVGDGGGEAARVMKFVGRKTQFRWHNNGKAVHVFGNARIRTWTRMRRCIEAR